MKPIAFFACSAFVALLAFIIACIDSLLKGYMPIGSEIGFTYISFISWAVYFFGGGVLKNGIKAAIGYVVGIVASIVIILLATCFASLGFFAVPLAIFVVVIPVLYLEKVPWFDLIPSIFVASGCYFGIMSYVPEASFGTAACTELTYAFIGLLFGWITIEGKSIISKILDK